MSKENKLQAILDIIAENPRVTRGEIERRLIRSRPDFALHRGRDSERRVKEVLGRFNFVSHITQTEPYKDEDQDGKDLIVILEEGHRVNVQVKSRDEAVENFIVERGGRLKLTRKKLVVINGQNEFDKIRQDFLIQIIEIDNRLRKVHKNPILSNLNRGFINSLLGKKK